MDTASISLTLYNILVVVVLLSWGASGFPRPEAIDSHTIHLQRVDAAGNTIPQVYHYDDISSNARASHYFRFTDFKGTTFFLELVKSREWMTGDVSVEVVRDSGPSFQRAPRAESSCHYSGVVRGAKNGENLTVETDVIGEVEPDSWAALSGCDGQLTGVIELAGDYYFIEAAPPTLPSRAAPPTEPPNPHILTRTVSKRPGQHCSTQSSRTREFAGKTSGRGSYVRRRRRRRSAMSLEHFMEVAVVTEPDMLKDRTIEDLEAYVFTIVNIVSHLYRDSSLGHSMKVALLRVIIVDYNQTNILTGNSGDHPLVQFCKWIGKYDKSRGLHEDVAILLTKQSMCDSDTDECNVLGMADIGTACMKGYSCDIVKDHGLSTAFSMAHELGHSLSMEHDGQNGVCSSEESFIMAASFTQSSNPHIWSQCSRNSLTQFLESRGSSCLRNRPPAYAQLFNSTGTVSLPGFEYSVTEQCQMSLGRDASGCSVAKNECSKLWCRPNNTSSCVNPASPPAPGTECRLPSGTGMGICYKGECVHYSSVLTPVEGGWSQWSSWTNCSLPCGTGIQSRTRLCNSPVPQFGGHYCVGKRKEFRVCNREACPGGHTHRQRHCEAHPPVPGHSNWTAVSMDRVIRLNLEVCKSHCSLDQSDDAVIYTSSLVSLPDGATCHTHQHSEGVCLSGECEPVGCDGMLWSERSKDECGIWCGDGSSCLRVAGRYTPTVSNGVYRYYMAFTIPSGSTYIRVSETTPSPTNYIAVRARGSSTFINGHYRVLYSGRTNFTLAKAPWLYERAQNNGAEVIATDGPVNSDVFVYVLAVRSYAGLSYSFSLPRNKMSSLTREVYFWKASEWKSCDAKCGRGKQRREVACSKLSPGGSIQEGVADDLCTTDKPELERECNSDEECRYSWATSEWSRCNSTCDGTGIETRTISCQRETHSGVVLAVVADRHCGEALPNSRLCQRGSCQYEWKAGSWGSCDAICGHGWRERRVTCVISGSKTEVEPRLCNGTTPPSFRGSCQSPAGSCSDYHWETSEWSQCLGQCWRGFKIRRRTCRHSNGSSVEPQFCHTHSPPVSMRNCVRICPPTTPTVSLLTTPTNVPLLTTPSPECKDQLATYQCKWLQERDYCYLYRRHCCHTCRSTT